MGGGVTNNAGYGIASTGTTGFVEIRKIVFGSVAHAHILCYAGSITITGPLTILSGASALYHMTAAYNASIVGNQPASVITFQGAASWTGTGSAFAYVQMLGSISVTYSATNNPGSVTGTRYNAILNGVINTGGSGANYYPGNAAGTTDTHGMYA